MEKGTFLAENRQYLLNGARRSDN